MTETGDVALKRTPLEDEHRALGAKIGAFAGWAMPIEYRGTLAEHQAVRERVGLFDLMHLGKVIVSGTGALGTLQRTVTNDVAKVGAGRAQYNTVLNERGGIVDDLIVYRLGEERYYVVPNAANTARVHAILLDEADDADVVLHEDWCFLAVQGPRSVEVVSSLFPEAAQLGYMHCIETRFEGQPVILTRSGYTGEVGFELFPPESVVRLLWRAVLEAGQAHGIEPIGLGARDTLRLEMGYPLHGQDISEERTPLEAGLSWAVAMDKGEFRGREALVKQKAEGIPARLWGLRMQDRLIPRSHYPVAAGDEWVGETTSGTFSPTLRAGIALAYLQPRERFSPGDEVEVDVRRKRGRALVTKPPFVDRSPK
ncbi:MAG: glycine cleavage system aminomethyltransferase GcvT [Actinomycetota bacterium]|nr:glycine cleavage system aminomethyltransferase GcvT [Actinomycetota bacterium]